MNPIYTRSSFAYMVPSFNSPGRYAQIIEELITIWLDDYKAMHKGSNVVETRSGNFSYLFDLGSDRLIAAWGISKGPVHEKRDDYRISKHPQAVPKYHRGHVIAHRLGGGVDINLLSQREKLNLGAFKVLENNAAKTPGALYFTYWIYDPARNNTKLSQVPSRVDQGLLIPGKTPEIKSHIN